jgi:RNA polymerase sigma-54 factor
MNTISIQQEHQACLKQHQQLLINLAMKQAFHVLQLPILELSEWLKSEIENNPVLEIDFAKESFKESLEEPIRERHALRNRVQEDLERRRKEHQENSLTASVSLYEHLMQQVPLLFEDRGDIQLAELIIGHLNDKGFLDTPLQEIAPLIPLETMQRILLAVQSLDPPGIGASNLRECLLLQLKLKQKENGHAAAIIREHFEDLLHNRLPYISQCLRISIKKLADIIEEEIVPLDLYPGYRYFHQPIVAIIPDLLFLCVEGKWQIEVNTSFLPRFQVAPIYVQALREHTLENDEYFYLRRQLSGGRWLKRIVQRRGQTLHRIGEFILKRQMPFFNSERARLTPLTMQEVARELSLNESTIARAVSNKYLACPQGLFSLKSFFNQGLSTQNGQKISNHTLRQMLSKTIDNEDKSQPLSDEDLSHHFHKLGISCARRTISKYRNSLRIAPAGKRKKWNGQHPKFP